jgi:pyruvate dehydrogenase E1 component
LLASTNPAVVHYDPAFAFEVGHIIKDGLRRMYGTMIKIIPTGRT